MCGGSALCRRPVRVILDCTALDAHKGFCLDPTELAGIVWLFSEIIHIKHRARNAVTPYKGWQFVIISAIFIRVQGAGETDHLQSQGSICPLPASTLRAWSLVVPPFSTNSNQGLHDKLFYFEYFLLSLNNLLFSELRAQPSINICQVKRGRTL